MKKLLTILLFISAFSLPLQAQKKLGDWEVDGSLSLSTLFVMDDLSSTTVAIVFNEAGDQIGVAVGPDIVTECSVEGRTCEFRSLQDTELVLGRTTDDGTEALGSFDSYTLLQSLGIRADGVSQNKKYSAKIHGTMSGSFKDDRALVLLGDKKYRFRFTDLYGQYDENDYRVRLGRQSTTSGTLFDGVRGDYKFGPEQGRDDKTIGIFAGLGPDLVTKHPGLDRYVFGSTFHFIPEFSSRSETRLRLDSTLAMETYKGSVDRFYLNWRAHFTPIRELSLFSYNTLELPWLGDGSLTSSLASLNAHWRPSNPWFFSLGFTQFRIDRHLQEESIQILVDPGSQQTTRIGESIDDSDRYRVDARLSYKPVYYLQPYVKGRYERRTFNSDNTKNDSGNEDLSLVDNKNAFRGIVGTRVFPLDKLETQTEFAYDRRYQSSGWYAYQAAYWDSPLGYTADIYFQYVSSTRDQDRSGSLEAISRDMSDYYLGAGGSYRFFADFIGQIRYDFASEEDYDLGENVYIHSVLLRLNYRF